MISVCLPGKPFNITVIQVCALTSNVEEAEWFCEDLQDLLELTPKKDVLFIIGDWNAKVESQETPGVTGKFGLGVQNEAGQILIDFFPENALVIANTIFKQHKRRLYTWTSPGQWQILIIFFRYDLNQIPYDYTVEVRNRFKGLDLIECLMSYGWRFELVRIQI